MIDRLIQLNRDLSSVSLLLRNFIAFMHQKKFYIFFHNRHFFQTFNLVS